jgi:glycosyltransferase involved in cell wall biosynthesis
MKRNSIVQISAYYPPHLGGQEIIVQQLATHLTMMGETVEIVTSNLGATAGITIENGIRVSRLKSAEVGHTAIIWNLLYWLLKHAGRDTAIHLHVGQAFTSEVVWLASKIRGFKYIMHMHIDPVPSGAMGKLLPLYKKLILRRAIRAAHVIVVLNDDHSRVIRHDYGYKGRLLVMSNGVEESFFQVVRRPARSGVIELLFVGRLSPQKNLGALLEAVSGSKQNLTLDIVGDGECRHQLEEVIRKKGLVNVRLHGELGREAVRGFYASRSALILPSLYEAQPVVLLEAMASRIPVIATRVVGIEAMAEGGAILIEPSWQGIAEGIDSFAAMSSATESRMVEAAFAKVRGLAWDALIESYSCLYDQLI